MERSGSEISGPGTGTNGRGEVGESKGCRTDISMVGVGTQGRDARGSRLLLPQCHLHDRCDGDAVEGVDGEEGAVVRLWRHRRQHGRVPTASHPPRSCTMNGLIALLIHRCRFFLSSRRSNPKAMERELGP